jgi:uncharacterized membrane protein
MRDQCKGIGHLSIKLTITTMVFSVLTNASEQRITKLTSTFMTNFMMWEIVFP